MHHAAMFVTTNRISGSGSAMPFFPSDTHVECLPCSGKNSVSTGYVELDKYMNGGFEPTRLYIYGGSSGDGKSVLLTNFLKNAVEKIHLK